MNCDELDADEVLGALTMRAEKAEAEAAEWKALAQELRNHESRIQGAIVDADDSIGSAERALDAIDSIVNGPRPTSAPTKGET